MDIKRICSHSVFIRFIAAVTVLLISLSLLPGSKVTASAQTATAIYYGDFGYIIDVDKNTNKFVASICEFRPADTTAATYDITIPETIDQVKYPVTSISPSAFTSYLYRDRIKSVKLPNSVTAIGDYAFRDCKILEKVDFGSDLLTIGKYAFSGCIALKEAKLPAKVTEIWDSAFNNCTSLKTATFPTTLTYVGQYAFSGCTTLEAAELPDSVKAIGSSAFDGCSSMKTLKLPSIITSIDSGTFHNCRSLVNATIPPSVKTIGPSAFADCAYLTTMTLPETIESVGAMAFANCKNLTAVIIPYTITNISDTAFMNSPVEIWGSSGSYADTYAYRNGIRFHSNGSVQKITFSADNMYATVNNIAIRSSKGYLVIPPSTVSNGEVLTINVTAPTDYAIDYITINGTPFANGATYSVGNQDVSIFVSYKRQDAITSINPSSTTVTTTNMQTTTTQNVPQTTSMTTVVPIVNPADDDDPDEDTTKTVEDDGNNGDAFVKVDSDLEDINGVKVKIITKRENFIGPAKVRITNTPEAYDAAKTAAESIDIENAMYYAFDISLYDERGKENQGIMAKGTITFQVPVPNALLKYANSLKVYHIEDQDPQLIKSSIIEDINGVKKVQFEASSFSPFMFIVDTGADGVPTIDDTDTTQPASNNPAADDDDDGEENVGIIEDDDNGGNNNTPDAHIVDDGKKPDNGGTRPNYNGNINPHTGAIIAGGAVCGISLICIPLVRRRKKRKRTKSPIE